MVLREDGQLWQLNTESGGSLRVPDRRYLGQARSIGTSTGAGVRMPALFVGICVGTLPTIIWLQAVICRLKKTQRLAPLLL